MTLRFTNGAGGRMSDFMLKEEYPNPLPNDGFPRMTKEALGILKEGLEGNFDQWTGQIGNHPLHLPSFMCRNVSISCAPDIPHFQATYWHGRTFPLVDGYSLAPTIEFDKLDISYSWDELIYVKLKNSKDSHFTTGVPVLIDDFGIDKKRTIYEEEVEECPTYSEPVKVRSLESFL